MIIVTLNTCACGETTALYDGVCHYCRGAHLSARQDGAPRPLTVLRAIDLLVAELLADDVPQPLAQRFTLAGVAADLCRLAGEPVPFAVLDALDGPAHATSYRAETHRERAVPAA